MADMHNDTTNLPDLVAKQPRKSDAALHIDHALQLKWGLALLGKDRAREYLLWLERKLQQQDN